MCRWGLLISSSVVDLRWVSNILQKIYPSIAMQDRGYQTNRQERPMGVPVEPTVVRYVSSDSLVLRELYHGPGRLT
jgi:hypothetical protein